MKNLHKQNGWIIALIVLIAVNFIAAQVHPRVDLTEEKRYSLSNGTKELLRSLDAPAGEAR